MIISDEKFQEFINQAVERTPPAYKQRLQNVAFILEDEPSAEQRVKMQLSDRQSLLGLYEGVPLPARGGTTKLLPDKITIFKNPLLAISGSEDELKENIRHTIWHEIAHYFGLDHSRIYKLDGSEREKE